MDSKVRWLVTICCSLAVAPAGGCAKESSKQEGAPRLAFEKTSWDVGEIPVDRRAPYSVEIACANHGSGRLNIFRLRASCGCARAAIDRTSLAPGETALINFDVKRPIPEERKATLTVYSDDPNSPATELSFSWRAVGAIEFDPPSLDLGSIVRGETASATATLICRSDVERDSLQMALTNPTETLRASWDSSTNEGAPARQRVRIEVAGVGPGGEAFGKVRIARNGSEGDDAVLPVRWRVSDAVEISPRSIMLRPGRAGERRTQFLTVSAAHSAKLAIEKIDVGENAVEAKLSRTKSGESFLVLSLESTLPDSPGCHQFALDLWCEEPLRKKISIPVVAYVLEAESAADR